MRGIAALAVVTLHASVIAGLDVRGWSAALAVDFFFCLSGFVVAHAYEERLRSGALSFQRFMIKRLVRLYPMIFAGAVIGFAAHIYAEHNAPWRDLGRSLLLIPRLDGWLTYPLNSPMWSLLYELLASVGFALFLKIAPKAVPWLVLPAGLALAFCILRAGHVDTFGIGGPGVLWKGSIRIAYPFILGVMLCRHRTRLPRVPALVAPTLLLAVLLIVSPPFRGVYQALATLIVLPLVVALGAKADVPGRLHFLGRLSYPLYLVHWGVLIVIEHMLHGLLSPLIIAAAGVVASCAAAWVALIAYDEPLRAWLASRLDGRQPLPAKAAMLSA